MKPTPSKFKGRLGLNYVESVALKAHCKPIPVPEDLDTGIDGFIEFSSEHSPTIVAFQVKLGSSFFDKQGAKHRAEAGHVRYWMNYPIPVILVIVNQDATRAFWMDARAHIRETVETGTLDAETCILRPPSQQRFEEASLLGEIRDLSQEADFGSAVTALSGRQPDTRMVGLSLMSRFRFERRAIFCIAAALRTESEPCNLASLCDLYSRYLSHPEATFGVNAELSGYARDMLTSCSHAQLLRILDAFNDEEHYGNWSGALEIFKITPEEIWHRFDVIERGTPQQGIAEIVKRASSREQLLAVISDDRNTIRQRNTAIALFGYLGYSCSEHNLLKIERETTDDTLRALLTWLRHWISVEAETV